MEGFLDYFSSRSDDYERFRPRYPAALFETLAAESPTRSRAWDVACGSGQATAALAAQFEQVTGSDASAEQISHALPAGNIEYRVARAEEIGAQAESIDLVTVAQALHWLDQERFFAEVDRVLKPQGLLAAWGYRRVFSESPRLDELLDDFEERRVGSYWPPEREILESAYRGVEFPYPRLFTPEFRLRATWTLDEFLGYLSTWSSVRRYEASLGRDPVEEARSEFLEAWGEPERPLHFDWPMPLYVGRKP
ncbi:MAG: class I SAM-dependent methyltransferase [Thermoanaerobaculia bacterium]|nr:class I SAM-dependent methyltransferase [Thermoanaerobaculia bacterium]